MLDDTTMAVPALVMPDDGVQVLIRTAVRGAIEVGLDEP